MQLVRAPIGNIIEGLKIFFMFSGNSNEDFSNFGKKVDDNNIADSVEPLKREFARAVQKIPDPRDMVPSTLPDVSITGYARLFHFIFALHLFICTLRLCTS